MLASVSFVSIAAAQVFETDEQLNAEFIVNDTLGELFLPGSDGSILRFDLETQVFLDPIDVGGSIFGLAFSPNDSQLFVGQREFQAVNLTENEITIHEIDLVSNAITDLNLLVPAPEGGVFDLAIGSNGQGIFTTEGNLSNPFRTFDALNGTFASSNIGPDGFGLAGSTTVSTSDNGQFILVYELGGPSIHLYDTNTQSFIATSDLGTTELISDSESAVSSDGSFVGIATVSGVGLFDEELNFLTEITTSDVSFFGVEGVAFSPDSQTGYFYDVASNEVFAFDTATFSIEERFILNGTPIEFSAGNRLIATSNGENLIVNLGNGFEIIDIATFFDVCDQVATTVTCASVAGGPFSSSIDGLMVTVTEEAAFNGTRALIFDGFDVALENAGVINGEIDFAFGESNDRIENSGLISGSVQFRGGDDTFINQAGGVISSRVGLGQGNDTIILEAGSVVESGAELRTGGGENLFIVEAGAVFDGSVTTGPGSFDTVMIMATGISIDQVAGFDVIEFDTGEEVLLNNSFADTIDTISILSGDLRLAPGSSIAADSLVLADGVNITGAGFLDINNDFEIGGIVRPEIGAEFLEGAQTPASFDVDIGFGNNITLLPSSILQIEFAATGVGEDGLISSSLISNGSTELEGGTLSLQKVGETPVLGEQSVTVLDAANGLTGTFDVVELPANYLLQGVTYLENSVVVDFRSQIGAGFSGLTTPAGVYAVYFDNLSLTSESGTSRELVSELITISSEAELDTALRDLSAEAYVSVDVINVETGFGISRAVDQVISFPTVEDGRFSPWISGLAVDASLDGTQNGASGTDINSQGGLIGFGFGLSDEIVVGAFAGVTDFEQEFDLLNAELNGDGFVFGGYAAIQRDGFNGRVLLVQSNGELEGVRAVPFLGEAIRSETDINTTLASVSGSYDFSLGNAFIVSPLLATTFISSRRDGFEEFDGVLANLAVDEQESTFLFGDIGIELATSEAVAGIVHPFAMVGYRYEVLGNDSETNARLSGEDESVLTLGRNIERARAIVSAGTSFHISTGISASVGYDGSFGSGFTRHQGTFNISVSF